MNLELSQTLDTLRMAKDQLVQSEKLAALGALVAGVSHELNTPIGNGLTVASALEHKVTEFERKIDGGLRRSDLLGFVQETGFAAEIITRNLERAGHLISSFKQVAVDQTSSLRRTFLLDSLVAEILLTLNPIVKKYACQVVVDVQPGNMLESYPGPLGQVLTNLITNALVHGFDTEDAGTITISAVSVTEATVQLVVRDTGRGIATENMHRIFEPFFTTRLGQGGSGLGLHIVHNMVGGILGGQIKAMSEPGRWSEFIVVIPKVAPQHIHD
ncbi:MAG: HAMP domain-containing histidine kinase [Candidatus Saccharibacteria bacterium]|nr:HAMP domain-containing histidine kinase [Rhodoferax sp.]